MKWQPTTLKDLYVLEIELLTDERGFFGRSFCLMELDEKNIDFKIVQTNISFNHKKGTLRGMHYQKAPKAEKKLVRCTKGKIFDVAIDLRPESLTYCQWYGVNLSAENYKILYIPEGFAHGFLTLEDNSEVLYFMGEFYHPEYATGVRWNDSAFNIPWPFLPEIISPKDNQWKDFLK